MSPSRRQATSRSATSFSSVVAVLVSERVVDVLEAVQVHHQQRERLAASAAPARIALFDAVREQHAVRQAGERVVQRLVLQRLGVGLALGDVAQAGDVDVPVPSCTSLRSSSIGNVEPSLR